jgi:polysaccharide deacetylase 2 family uncharacterized protein YibQ
LPRKRSKGKGPLRTGAALIFLAIAAVVAVILWPIRNGTPSEDAPIPLPTPAPARRPAAEGSVAPQTLTDRLALYLADRRLPVEPGTRGVDLICGLPPGRSSFRIHADLSEAMRIWGGEAVAGEETVLPGTGRVVDLTVTESGESRVIRLVRRGEADTAPRIAIVIDDFGHQSQSLIDGFFRLPFPFTPAVLPGYARSVATVRRARDAGRPPILHLPMEPLDAPRHDPGEGAIRTGMQADEIRKLIDADLHALAGVTGVSNHMGSLACEKSELVGPMLDALLPTGLFFLDNGTSERSVVPAEAARRGVRCLSADLYLDGEADPTRESMKKRLNEARRIAESSGSVILVGHARPATLEFLEASQDSFRAWGCRPVALGDLLR